MKCKCKTKSGKPCSRNAEQNSKYCWQHAEVASVDKPLAPGPPGPSPKRQSPQRRSPKRQSPQRKSPQKKTMTPAEREKQRKYCHCVMAGPTREWNFTAHPDYKHLMNWGKK